MNKLRKELSTVKADKLLDLASRDGGFAKEIILGLESCNEAIALDITDKMFEKGHDKCAGLPVKFVVGDACKIPYDDDSFDIVSLGNSLHHIPDIKTLLSEMKRVVKPDGLLIIGEMYNDGQPCQSLSHWILHDIDCTMHTVDGKYHANTYSKPVILNLIKNAGFKIEKTFTDFVDDPKVTARLKDRIAAVPGNVPKYEGKPEYALIAAKAKWLEEEYAANGVKSAEQLVIIAKKQSWLKPLLLKEAFE